MIMYAITWIVFFALSISINSQAYGQYRNPFSPADSAQVREDKFSFGIGIGYARGVVTGGNDAVIISSLLKYKVSPSNYIETSLKYTNVAQGKSIVINSFVQRSIRSSWIGDITYLISPIPTIEHLQLGFGASLLQHSALETTIVLGVNSLEASYYEYLSIGLQTKLQYSFPIKENLYFDVHGQVHSFLPKGSISFGSPFFEIASQFMLLNLGVTVRIVW